MLNCIMIHVSGYYRYGWEKNKITPNKHLCCLQYYSNIVPHKACYDANLQVFDSLNFLILAFSMDMKKKYCIRLQDRLRGMFVHCFLHD